MKTAAKVFLILGMIVGFPAIIPIIVGACTISKINNAKSQSELVGWGIASIFFAGIIGGILTLCITDDELRQDNGQSPERRMVSSDYIDKLKDLKKLYDDGAIDEDEYNRLKKGLLKD